MRARGRDCDRCGNDNLPFGVARSAGNGQGTGLIDTAWSAVIES